MIMGVNRITCGYFMEFAMAFTGGLIELDNKIEF